MYGERGIWTPARELPAYRCSKPNPSAAWVSLQGTLSILTKDKAFVKIIIHFPTLIVQNFFGYFLILSVKVN